MFDMNICKIKTNMLRFKTPKKKKASKNRDVSGCLFGLNDTCRIREQECVLYLPLIPQSVLLGPGTEKLLCGGTEQNQTFGGQINLGKTANHTLPSIVRIIGIH